MTERRKREKKLSPRLCIVNTVTHTSLTGDDARLYSSWINREVTNRTSSDRISDRESLQLWTMTQVTTMHDESTFKSRLVSSTFLQSGCKNLAQPCHKQMFTRQRQLVAFKSPDLSAAINFLKTFKRREIKRERNIENPCCFNRQERFFSQQSPESVDYCWLEQL